MSEFEGYSGQGFSPAGDKGRFVLPPDLRKAVKESSGGQKILCLAKHDRWNCLVGFGLSRHGELTAELDREETNALAAGKEFDRELKSMRLFGYKKLSFDDSGRFVLPEPLRKSRNIAGGMFFQSAGRFFTIWAPEELANMPEEWEDIQADCEDLMAEAEAKAAKKGGAK